MFSEIVWIIWTFIRFLKAEDSCAEYGCSYSKEEFPGDVFCFKEGPYPTEAGQCPNVPEGTYM